MSPWERGDDFPLTFLKEPPLSEPTRAPLPSFPRFSQAAPPGKRTGARGHWGVFCRPHITAGSLGPPSGVPGTHPATTPGETQSGVTPACYPLPRGRAPWKIREGFTLHPFWDVILFRSSGRVQSGPIPNPPSRGGLRAQPGSTCTRSGVSLPQQARELGETSRRAVPRLTELSPLPCYLPTN